RVEPAEDAFVELVSAATAARSLGDVVVRDAQGNRFIGACAASLGELQGRAIFGGCTGPGSPLRCDTHWLANAAPEAPGGAPNGLGLAPSGDAVFLLDRSGRIMDRLLYGEAPVNASWARGTSGQCDSRPVNADVQIHAQCLSPDAASAFSPGLRANGSDFGVFAEGEVCATARTLHPEAGPLELTTAGGTNAYDASLGASAACREPLAGKSYPGRDTVFRVDVPPGQRLTVWIQSGGGFNPSLALFTDCGAPGQSCLAASDRGGPGATESVTYDNTGAEVQRVFVAVDSDSLNASGAFAIDASLQGP
ncbi:MAG TPA: hypothetical protein VEY30_10165, partial [Myxococcaceae bacterium]|nr:hypothetical protein [Myxococcaceae bacterium]